MIVLQEDFNVSDYTLILPSVAVGNVGQLSLDLIISSLGLRRVGRIFNSSFIPVVGADPYEEASDDICTSIDFYVSDEKKLVALQVRSPLIGKPTQFFQEILNFVKEHKIAKMVILTSSFSHVNRDEQLRTLPFRYLASENALKEYGKQFEDMSWMALEPQLVDEFSNQKAIQIHGGGFAKSLFEFLQKNNIPCVIIVKYCSEGDNIPDAIELINHFDKWLQLFPTENNVCKLKFPPSWKFLFGNSPPREIY